MFARHRKGGDLLVLVEGNIFVSSYFVDKKEIFFSMSFEAATKMPFVLHGREGDVLQGDLPVLVLSL